MRVVTEVNYNVDANVNVSLAPESRQLDEDCGQLQVPEVGASTLEWALAWAGAGYAVHPLRPKDKRPATPNGFKDAVTDEATIRQWFEDSPLANYGIACGRLVVLDADEYKAIWKPLDVTLTPTFITRTAHGGRQYYFLTPEGVQVPTRGGFAPGWDSRGVGGYVVGPGCYVDDEKGAGAYEVIDARPFALLPQVILDKYLIPPPKKRPMHMVTVINTTHEETSGFRFGNRPNLGQFPQAQHGPHWVDYFARKAEAGGGRNNNAYLLGQQLRNDGYDENEAHAFANEYYARVADDTYTPEENDQAMKNGYKGEPRPAAIFHAVALPPLDEAALTDVGNAKRFAIEYGHKLKHVSGWGWIAFDGKRWRRGADKQAQEWATACLWNLLAEARGLDDERLGREVAQHALKSMSGFGIRNMLAQATSKPQMSASVDDFDQSPHLLNVANGTLNLKTGRLQPHDAKDMLTQMTKVNFDAQAEAPRFLRFLDEIFPASPELIRYLQTFIGYTATGETRAQKWLYLSGVGANGKGVLIRTLAHVLDEYATDIASDALTRAKGQEGGEKATPSFHRLPGKRFVYAQEPGGDSLDDERLKQLVDDGQLTVNPKHKDAYSFTMTHKLWLAANKRLNITDTSNAVWRRTVPVEFLQTFQPDQEPDLRDKLEAEASGILAWIVRGAVRWYAEGLGNLPEAIEATKREYRAEQDPTSVFFTDVIEPDAAATLPLSDAAILYAAWYEQHRYIGAESLAPTDTRKMAKLARKHGITVKAAGNKNIVSLVGYRPTKGDAE